MYGARQVSILYIASAPCFGSRFDYMYDSLSSFSHRTPPVDGDSKTRVLHHLTVLESAVHISQTSRSVRPAEQCGGVATSCCLFSISVQVPHGFILADSNLKLAQLQLEDRLQYTIHSLYAKKYKKTGLEETSKTQTNKRTTSTAVQEQRGRRKARQLRWEFKKCDTR